MSEYDLKPKKMKQEDFDFIVRDAFENWWVDNMAHEWVLELCAHIIAVDPKMKIPEVEDG